MGFQAAYIPIGVGTFHLESAKAEFDKSVKMLKEISDDCICPGKYLLNIDDLKDFLAQINPDLIILQNITFANAAYASEILKRFDCPILLWTLREPVIDGGRLRLNSLTGAFSAANAVKNFRKNTLEYMFGSPEEKEIIDMAKKVIKAAKVKKNLKNLKITAIGHTPQGFGFGRALDLEMMSNFGATLESIEAGELMARAKSYSDEECEPYLNEAEKYMKGLEETPEKNKADFARLYKAYKDFVLENGIGAIASRCWPDFFTLYGTPVCGVLSLLNALGIAAGCEADTYGALSMFIGTEFTGKACYFGDPVSLDEDENTITFWHCGMAACTLAREDTGAEVGVHPNRKIGPTMEFGCKPYQNATIFRFGRKPDGTFRLFIARGEVLDKPKQFCGTSIVVKTKNYCKNIIINAVKEGWEPHFAVAYGKIAEELEILGNMLDMEICKY